MAQDPGPGGVEETTSQCDAMPWQDIPKWSRLFHNGARLRTGQGGGSSNLNTLASFLNIELHWLPVKQRIIFKVGVSGYKAIHGLAPPYLKELFVSVSIVPALSRNRSASSGTSSLHP